VLDATPSNSKNDRGIVTVETKGFNQDGLEVCYFRRKVMVWKREFAPNASAPTVTTSGSSDLVAFRRALLKRRPRCVVTCPG
jgi:hypothetical protein